MQTDPIGYADGLNMYDYVGGDPVNKTDPTGLATCEDIGFTTIRPGSTSGSGNDTTVTAPLCNRSGASGGGTSIDLSGTVKSVAKVVYKGLKSIKCGIFGGCKKRKPTPSPVLTTTAPSQSSPPPSKFFACGGFSVGAGGGLCTTGDKDIFMSAEVGLPGPSGVLGYAPNGAASFLAGRADIAAPFVGMGFTPSGDYAFIVGTPTASSSYGINTGERFNSLFSGFSSYTYNRAGRPYDFP